MRLGSSLGLRLVDLLSFHVHVHVLTVCKAVSVLLMDSTYS